MKLPKLLFWCAVAYAILLVLVRGTLPADSTSTVSLVGVPLIVIAAIIARDLARRSTNPTVSLTTTIPSSLSEDPVKFLSDQIRVAANASDSYFDNIVRARLKDLLITKVALEKGMDRDVTRRVMLDPQHGMELLDNEELYAVLYGPAPARRIRIRMIDKAVDMIGAWKG